MQIGTSSLIVTDDHVEDRKGISWKFCFDQEIAEKFCDIPYNIYISKC